MTALSLLGIVAPIFMLLCGLSSFVAGRKHLLNTLLSLEYIMLSIFWLMVIMIAGLGGDSYFVLFFLTLAACEGALGLALLVSVVRTHGNDNFSSFMVLQC
uniref:NADH dehydrogenase subunit 4L n=1 Tax=Atya gabonensis TaxID=1450316 RepID=UPI0023D7F1F2|nr:NADH dehydrogenase subunit 4L [Atyopsis gabonensis]WDD39084.1 NADH dehydrogenase subunit 4L [Atyopsis gabonensis]